jgi:hypothetical protein
LEPHTIKFGINFSFLLGGGGGGGGITSAITCEISIIVKDNGKLVLSV